ncbi:MAG: DnaB-like helicase N-terminal domain-containing protein [Candidatus Paceibacterales bacterium]
MADNTNIQRIPPQNMEAEMSVLGCLMLDKDALLKIGDVISADDFYDDRNKKIFEAIIALYEKSVSIDILTVTNWLEERKMLDKVGGSSYLTQLVNAVPSSAHIAITLLLSAKKAP